MAQWHSDDLENALKRRGWEIVSRQEGDDARVAGTWAIQRSRKIAPLLSDFDGFNVKETLPIATVTMERSYGCNVRHNSLIGLYFSRKGDKSSSHRAARKENLSDFVAQLDDLENP